MPRSRAEKRKKRGEALKNAFKGHNKKGPNKGPNEPNKPGKGGKGDNKPNKPGKGGKGDNKPGKGGKPDKPTFTPTPGTPSKPGTPGKPGVKNPTVNPFLNGEDLMDLSEAKTAYANKLYDIDRDLEQSRLDTNYAKSEIDRKHVRDVSDVNDDAAGRGIFRSSIRDAALYDVDGQAVVGKALLDTQLSTQLVNAQTQKLAAQEAFDRVQAALDRKAVENAAEVNLDVGIWAEPPTPATPGTPAKPGAKPPPKPGKPNFTPQLPGGGLTPSKPNKPNGPGPGPNKPNKPNGPGPGPNKPHNGPGPNKPNGPGPGPNKPHNGPGPNKPHKGGKNGRR